jgi:hypothetical protein
MAGSGLRRLLSLTPACCFWLVSGSVAAQTNASDKAAAEALFDQGVRLMKQNNFADACPKLEESDRIDPAVGTLLYLGECYERVGKTASAWATFREAASIANNSNQADRARIASNRAQALEPKLSRLSVEVSPEVARIPGVVVKRGAQRIEASLYGTPLPVDPGEYRIDVTAPGYEAWSAPIKVEAGGASASVRVPGLVKAAAATPATETTTPAVDSSSRPGPLQTSVNDDLPAPSSTGLTTPQTLGLVAGGIGLIGFGIGSYFGVRAISRNSDAEEHCPKSGFCNDDEGLSLTDKAQRDATASNIAFIAGGVLVATGAVLYLTGGPSRSDRVALVPTVSPRTAAASLVGRF